MDDGPERDPADHDSAPDDAPDGTARGEIVAPGATPLAGADRGTLVHWLEQSHRDAQANRAQARELVRALEQVRDAHEYVGRALRDEQRKSRRLVAALIVAPLLAAIVVWGVWDRLDAVREDVSSRIREVAEGQDALRRAQDELRFGEVAQAQEARADALEAELERIRADLATERLSAAARADARVAEESRLREEIARLADDGAEVAGLRAQLQALRSRSGAESARAGELERELRRLERELGAVQATVQATGQAAGEATGQVAVATAGGTPRPADVAPAHVPPAAAPTAAAEPPPVVEPDPKAGAVRRPEDLNRIRDELNRLLALAGDPVKYRVEDIGGVRGETLLDVRVSGVDGQGRAIRVLEAASATVRIREDSDDVLLDLRDGHLLLAGRKAPFFDGRYAIVVDATPQAWRVSGLTCLTFE